MKKRARQQSKRKSKNAPTAFHYQMFFLAVIFLFASIVICYIYFPEPVKQSMDEKFEIMKKNLYSIMDRKVMASNDTETHMEFIDEVFELTDAGFSQDMFEYGVVPILLKLMNSTNSTIQYEAAKTTIHFMKNGTDYPEVFVSEGAVPPFLQLIHSKNEKTANMALMGFFFMLHEKAELSNTVFKMGLDKNLVELISSNPSTKILNTAVTILMNVCKNENPSISLESVSTLLPAFSELLLHSDAEIFENAYVPLYFLTENSNLRLQLKFDNEMIKILINQINHENPKVQLIVLLILTNVANDQSPINLDDEMLKQLPNLLTNNKDTAVKIGHYIILKYIDANPNQSNIIFEANLLHLIIDKLTHNISFIQKQAVAIILLIVNNGQHISTILNMQIIPKLYGILLETSDDETKQMILNTFNLLIQLGDVDIVYDDIEKVAQFNQFKEFSKFSTHSNVKIRHFSRQILEAFNFKNSMK